MSKSKWPDFLFTIVVRFVCGIFLGGLACFFFTWRDILHAFSHNDTLWPLLWLALSSFAGGFIAAFTVPRWQTPWYRRVPIDLNPTDFASPHVSSAIPESNRKFVSVKTVDEHGHEREYSSMGEVPPEIRSEIEALQKETARQKGKELSVTKTSITGNAITSTSIHKTTVSVYKITDESGVERTYHSLDEMPPEIRAAITEAEVRRRPV